MSPLLLPSLWFVTVPMLLKTSFKSLLWLPFQVNWPKSIKNLTFLGGPTAEKSDPLQSKLNKVEQLTGFSDPVYAEAYVNVNQYDIVLDVLVVNQTADTLQVRHI